MALNSFFTALSGLSAQSSAINVVGDNLANLNTVGFKGSTIQFADLVGQGTLSPSGNPMQEGLGTRVASIVPLFEQGTMQSTGNPLDVALDGNGFLLVQGDSAEIRYTRAGNLAFAANGDLVSANGEAVLGWQQRAVDGSIPPSATPARINIPPDLTVPPSATSELSMGFNLDAGAAVGTAFSTSVTTYDSLGAPHVLDLAFTKGAAGSWTFDVTINGGELAGGIPGTPTSLASGTLQFDSSGNLDAAVGVNGAPPAAITIGPSTGLANGGAPLQISWNPLAADGTSNIHGFSGPSVVLSSQQDGYGAGTLASIQVDSEGVIVGRFSNGETLDLARLAVGAFRNPQGLQRVGASGYAETRASGEPVIGEAGAGGRGRIIGGALEMSNVDIAEQFTSLILAQRGYQASSRVITATDELMQEAVNLKR